MTDDFHSTFNELGRFLGRGIAADLDKDWTFLYATACVSFPHNFARRRIDENGVSDRAHFPEIPRLKGAIRPLWATCGKRFLGNCRFWALRLDFGSSRDVLLTRELRVRIPPGLLSYSRNSLYRRGVAGFYF